MTKEIERMTTDVQTIETKNSLMRLLCIAAVCFLVFSAFVFENILALSADFSVKEGCNAPIFGPSSGALKHAEDGYIKEYEAEVYVKNFIAEATFHNPYSSTRGNWDYGFLFRDPQVGTLKIGTFHSIRVTSNGRWKHNVVTNGDWNTVEEGNVSGLWTGAGQINCLRIVVLDNGGAFYVNDQFVALLDTSKLTIKGDISVATGISKGSEIKGEVTNFEDFTVWSLDALIFDLSSEIVERVEKLYSKLGDSSGERLCSLLVEEVNSILQKQEKADTDFAAAQECFEKNDYENALTYAQNAKILYKELENVEKQADCDELLTKAEQELKRQRRTMIIGASLVLSILFVAITVYTIKKRQKAPPELERDKKTLDKMLSKGLISQKEYEIAKKDIDEQLKESKGE